MKDIYLEQEEFKCQTCNNVMDAISSVNPDDVPFRSEGDFNICMYCGAVYRFDADIKLQPATVEDLNAAAKEDPSVVIQIAAAKEFILNIAREKCENYKCCTCGLKFTAQIDAAGAPPEQGDFMLCTNCITLHRVAPDYVLQHCSAEQIEQMRKDLPNFEQVYVRMNELNFMKTAFFDPNQTQQN